MTTARDLMSSPAQSLSESDTVLDAAQALAQYGVGSLPVVDADGGIIGVVTDRDIVVKGLAEGIGPEKTVDHVMTDTVVVVEADDDIEAVTNALTQNQVRRVPVVEGNKVVGVISQADVARELPTEQTGSVVQAISQED